MVGSIERYFTFARVDLLSTRVLAIGELEDHQAQQSFPDALADEVTIGCRHEPKAYSFVLTTDRPLLAKIRATLPSVACF